jgi:threonylcarbamoyladenosine tRNA methylthiotransferase MtaB
VFPFSPRKGTAAAEFPDHVDHETIKARAGELRDISRRKRNEFKQSCLGSDLPVLVQNWHSEDNRMVKGLSDNYLSVIFHSDEMEVNRIAKVKIDKIDGDAVIGKCL